MMKILNLIAVFLLFSITSYSQNDPEKHLKEMGIDLPEVSQPIANYVKYVKTGNLIFLAGHGPTGEEYRGKLGADLSVEQGYAAARNTTINILSTLKSAVGDLNNVVRIVKVTGMVSSAEDFYDQPKVINGCSDLLTEVFGENGKHARAAVGMASLPGNICVEIEIIVEVKQ